MQYEFAPLEGITGYIYRNAHHACFPSMDRYYTPFITPKKGKSFTTREWNDIAAEHNQNIAVVPQILTNQAEGFCKVAGMLKEQGYEEVNLNLGCPSATVTAKKKGAGFLADPDALDAFLEEIFAHSPLKISIKTRIGVENPDEFERLLDIFSQYPIQKLIGQFVITGIFAYYIVTSPDIGTGMLIPFTGKYLQLPVWLFVPALFFIILGTDNGVNFTDGLDGLCTSVTILVATFFTIVAIGENSGILG